MRFGVSTHLYHDRRLQRDHLAQVAAYGFEAIELFATRSHFDYRDEAAIDLLKQWLAETGLTLNSVHAPITDLFGRGDQWSPTYSNAVNDRERREAAVRETDTALKLAERIPFDVLVVHLGTPTSREVAGDNNRASAVRSLEEISNLAGARGVRVAVEVIPNKLSDAAALATMLEREIDVRHAGICFDFGHAHLAALFGHAFSDARPTWSTPSRTHRSTSSRRISTTTAGRMMLTSCRGWVRSTGTRRSSRCRRSATWARI